MEHRHLNHQRYTLAAIDDVISRGRLDAWLRLRDRVRRSPAVRGKVVQVCRAYEPDPSAQRYRFWQLYAENQE